MTVLDLPTASMEMAGFYTPKFEVRIEGVGLPQNVLRDVIQITYKDNIKEIDSVELTINNWDPTTNDFKYEGSDDADHELFEPCQKEFELWLGYEPEKMTLMMKGHFTTVEPTFPASGGSTLSVRGLNVLHKLRRKQYTTSWENKKDSWVARNIATLKDKGEKRFPMPIEIDEAAMNNDEPEIDYLAEENQYDIDFLLYRARVRGYVVTVREEEEGKPQRVYFGPSDSKSVDETYKLEWEKSLIDFKPTLTTANQVKSVTVNGWDRSGKKQISEKCDLDCLRKNRDFDELLEKCDPREEIVVNQPVFTRDQARRLAQSLLTDRHKELIKASGTSIGLPKLRAGRKCEIGNLGARFSGTYFITESTHTFNDSGYITKFKARREHEDSFMGATQ